MEIANTPWLPHTLFAELLNRGTQYLVFIAVLYKVLETRKQLLIFHFLPSLQRNFQKLKLKSVLFSCNFLHVGSYEQMNEANPSFPPTNIAEGKKMESVSLSGTSRCWAALPDHIWINSAMHLQGEQCPWDCQAVMDVQVKGSWWIYGARANHLHSTLYITAPAFTKHPCCSVLTPEMKLRSFCGSASAPRVGISQVRDVVDQVLRWDPSRRS